MERSAAYSLAKSLYCQDSFKVRGLKKLPNNIRKNVAIFYGDEALESNPFDAIEAYKIAGIDPKEKFLEALDKYKDEWDFDDVIEVCQKIKAVDKLIEIADKWLEDGDCSIAIKAYKAVGKKPTKEQLIKCGDKRTGVWYDVIEAYTEAGEKEKLIEYGDLCLQAATKGHGDERGYEVLNAIECFENAGNEERLIKAGDVALEVGSNEEAIDAYKKAQKLGGTLDEERISIIKFLSKTKKK